MTKLERKSYYDKCKRTLRKTWDSVSELESDEEKDQINVPDNFKTYTVQNRTIALQKPKRDKPTKVGESYDGLEYAKQMDLANPGEDPKPVFIATDLSLEEEELLLQTLWKYRDVIAWSYIDLKGVDPEICKHTIPTRDDAKPHQLCPCTYNNTFARKIKE